MESFFRYLCVFVVMCSLSLESHAYRFSNPLIDAADKGKQEELQRYLTSKNAANVTGDFGVTPLMRAAFRGHASIVQLLLDHGALPNTVDVGGATALHLAARNDYPEVVEVLLSGGADINAQDRESWTPLMRAMVAGRKDVVKLLVEKGADVSLVNQLDESAIVHAATVGSIELLDVLLASDSFSNVPDTQLEIARFIAEKKDNSQFVSAVDRLLRGESTSVAEVVIDEQELADTVEETESYNIPETTLEDETTNDGESVSEPFDNDNETTKIVESPSVVLPEIEEDNVAYAPEIEEAFEPLEAHDESVEVYTEEKELGEVARASNSTEAMETAVGALASPESQASSQLNSTPINGTPWKESSGVRSQYDVARSIFDSSVGFSKIGGDGTSAIPTSFTPESTTFSSDTDGGFYVQLGTFLGEDEALYQWENIKRNNADIFTGLEPHVTKSFIAKDRLDLFRLRSGAFATKHKANEFCNVLRSREVQCFVVETAVPAKQSSFATAKVEESQGSDDSEHSVVSVAPVAVVEEASVAVSLPWAKIDTSKQPIDKAVESIPFEKGAEAEPVQQPSIVEASAETVESVEVPPQATDVAQHHEVESAVTLSDEAELITFTPLDLSEAVIAENTDVKPLEAASLVQHEATVLDGGHEVASVEEVTVVDDSIEDLPWKEATREGTLFEPASLIQKEVVVPASSEEEGVTLPMSLEAAPRAAIAEAVKNDELLPWQQNSVPLSEVKEVEDALASESWDRHAVPNKAKMAESHVNGIAITSESPYMEASPENLDIIEDDINDLPWLTVLEQNGDESIGQAHEVMAQHAEVTAAAPSVVDGRYVSGRGGDYSEVYDPLKRYRVAVPSVPNQMMRYTPPIEVVAPQQQGGVAYQALTAPVDQAPRRGTVVYQAPSAPVVQTPPHGTVVYQAPSVTASTAPVPLHSTNRLAVEEATPENNENIYVEVVPVIPAPIYPKPGDKANAPRVSVRETHAEDTTPQLDVEAIRKQAVQDFLEQEKKAYFERHGAKELSERQEEYGDFYQGLHNNVQSISGVSEAVPVPESAYFFDETANNRDEHVIENWLQIGEFVNEERAKDYWLRMFKYNSSLSHLKMVIIKPVTESGPSVTSIRVGPISVGEGFELCRSLKSTGKECTVVSSDSVVGSTHYNREAMEAETAAVAAKAFQRWINLGAFADRREAEYYWMFLKDDHEDVLDNIQHVFDSTDKMQEFGDAAIKLKMGPFTSSERAKQVCDVLLQRNVACLVSP